MAFGQMMTAIGTGLGGFLDGYDKAKASAQKREAAALQMQEAQEQQKRRQQQDQASSMLFGGLLNGGLEGGAAPRGGLPGSTRMPGFGGGDTEMQPSFQVESGAAAPSSRSAPQYQPGPAGSGFSSGLQRLTALGVRPEVAQGAIDYMAKNESGSNPQAVNPTSGAFGRAQWLGPRKAALTQQYGDKPSDEQQADFMGSELQGPERRTLDRLRTASSGKEGYDIWGRDFERPGSAALAKAGVGGSGGGASPLYQEAQSSARNAAQGLDPMVYGRMSLSALAQRIEQANPGADPVVKMLAVEQAAKLLAPDQQKMWEMFKLQHEDTVRRELADRQDARQDKSLAASDVRQERSLAASDERQQRNLIAGEQRQEQRDKAAEERQDKRLSAGTRASQNVEVTDGEGKVIFSGSARQTAQGWVADKDQQPIQVPDDGNVKITGRGGQGRQAAAQIQSMIGASSELVGEAKNLMELPSTAVAGIFQGVQSVPANKLGEAMARTLANKLTPEEATDLATSFQGVARSLATIEAQGRATGLVGLTGMSQGLMPQTGDTTGNVLRKMATLRQIMERNIDAIEASPNASAEQKKLLKSLREEMATVVPFTVSEVNKLQHGDAESVMQAAKKFGLGGADKGGADAGGGEVIQNGWRYDAKTKKPIGPVQ